MRRPQCGSAHPAQISALLRVHQHVVLFERKQDAERFLDALPKRFGKYGLALHPDKTRLVAFRRPGYVDNDDDRRGTFHLLGFTLYWGRSRKGNWVVMKRTAKDRFNRALRRILSASFASRNSADTVE